MTRLVADVRVARGSFELDVSLSLAERRTLAIVGPNGAGKSSLVGALAGFVEVGEGRILVGDRVLTDTAAGIDLPMDKRRVGVVFQDHLLFPHLTVLQNVAFGPRSVGREDATAHAAAWLDRLGIASLAAQRPRQLSGGQAQRVALARTLAAEPEVLVLDEPFASLDVEVRADVRAEVALHLGGFPGHTILVSHDIDDVSALADEMLVIESGRVSQRGTLAEIEASPATAYIRRLLSGRGEN